MTVALSENEYRGNNAAKFSAAMILENRLVSRRDILRILKAFAAAEVCGLAGLSFFSGLAVVDNFSEGGASPDKDLPTAPTDPDPVDGPKKIKFARAAVPTMQPQNMPGGKALVQAGNPESTKALPTPDKEFVRLSLPRARSQSRHLDCETTGTEILAKYYGYNVPADELLTILMRRDTGDPDQSFVGNPNAKEVGRGGYGVYPQALADALRTKGINAQALKAPGIAFLDALLATGNPALIIAVINFPPYQEWRKMTWKSIDGRDIIAYDGEHSYVVYGKDNNRYLVWNTAQSAAAAPAEWVSKAKLDASWALFDRRALIIIPPK